jgi:hypothetical protein
MRRTGTIIALILALGGIVFALGLPWLLKKHRTPAEYVANEVATTKEIQEFDMMWTGLESLQKKSTELGPEQYKQQFLASTTAYLQLDSEQTEKFVNVVDEGLKRLDAARDLLTRTRQQTLEQEVDAGTSQDSWSGESPASIAARRDAWSQWRNDQRESSDILLSALQPTPRHDLLSERRLLWLLKLDFSLRDEGK